MSRGRRLWAGGLAASLLASGILSTSMNSAQADSPVLNVISLYHATGTTPEAASMQLAISKFEAASGAKVNLIEAGQDLATQYNSDLLNGSEADVMVVNLFDATSAWLDNGASVPVGGYIKQWGLDKAISQAGINDWTSKNGGGAVQGFPYAGFTWPVWYNMQLLKKAGIKAVPTTTQQLIADAKLLRKKGIAPFVTGGSDWSGNKLWLQIVESYMKPAEAAKVFAHGGYCSDPNAMKGIKLFTQLRDAGVFVNGVQGYTADQMNNAFYAGKAAMMSAGSWAMPSAPKAVAAVTKMGGFPVPAGAYYKKPTAFQAYSAVGFFISPNGLKHLNLVRQFISTFYQSDVIAKFVSDVAIVPATKTPLTPASLSSASPLLAQSVTTLPKQVDYALFPDAYVGAVGTPLTKATALAYARGTTAQSICSAADAAYQQ